MLTDLTFTRRTEAAAAPEGTGRSVCGTAWKEDSVCPTDAKPGPPAPPRHRGIRAGLKHFRRPTRLLEIEEENGNPYSQQSLHLLLGMR